MCRFSIGAALSQQSFCNCLLLFLFSFFAFIVVVVCCYYCCCFCFCYCRAVHFSLNRRIVFCVSCSCFFVIFIFYAFALCSSVLCSAYTNTFISSNSFLFLNFFLSDMRFFFSVAKILMHCAKRATIYCVSIFMAIHSHHHYLPVICTNMCNRYIYFFVIFIIYTSSVLLSTKKKTNLILRQNIWIMLLNMCLCFCQFRISWIMFRLNWFEIGYCWLSFRFSPCLSQFHAHENYVLQRCCCFGWRGLVCILI